MLNNLLLLALLICSLSLFFQQASCEFTTLSFQVEPQREDCVYQDVPAGAELEATALVFRGGKLDVKLRVENPNKVVMYEKLLFSNIDDRTGELLSTIVRKGTTFRADIGGVYTICIDNRMARWTAKVLTLEIDIRDPNDVIAKAEREAKEAREKAVLGGLEVDPKVTFTLMRASANRIHNALQVIEGDQTFHYHRERRHRETIDSTEKRLHWWSFGETAVIVLSVVVQVGVVTLWWFREPTAPLFGSPMKGGKTGGIAKMVMRA